MDSEVLFAEGIRNREVFEYESSNSGWRLWNQNQ